VVLLFDVELIDVFNGIETDGVLVQVEAVAALKEAI
jgi:hypothetical protein